MKTCTNCKIEKSSEYFRHKKGHKVNKDGLNSTCRLCDSLLDKQYRLKKLEANPLKFCDVCKIEKHYSLIKRSKSIKICIICKELRMNIEIAKIASNSFEKRIQLTDTEKRCSKCRIFKSHNLFWKSNSTTDGFYSSCIDCTKMSQEKCRPSRLIAQKQWRSNNKQSILDYKNVWEKNRRKIDPEFRLKRIVNTSIRNALLKNSFTNNKIQKLNKIIFEHLSYTADELKQHIESQWESWMNWDNYGKYDPNKDTWQIDHIIPQSKLPYTSIDDDNFKKCWDLSNLRPLETIANIRKSNKVE